jgi:hypothetical protein
VIFEEWAASLRLTETQHLKTAWNAAIRAASQKCGEYADRYEKEDLQDWGWEACDKIHGAILQLEATP